MNIGLIKIEEDASSALYKAFQSVQGESYFSKSGNLRYKSVTKYATIKYNKTNHNTEFVWEKTDPYYKEHKNVADHMRVLVLGKMMKCNKEGYFPDKTGIATG